MSGFFVVPSSCTWDIEPAESGRYSSITEAFRAAKLAAGWEVLATSLNGKVKIGVPVDRNMRGQHGTYVPAEMKRGTGR